MAGYRYGPNGEILDDPNAPNADPNQDTLQQQAQASAPQPSADATNGPVAQQMRAMSLPSGAETQNPATGSPPEYPTPASTGADGGNKSAYLPDPTTPAATSGATSAPTAYANGWTPQANNAPPGFDGPKWADTTHNSPKYTVGRIMASGGTIQQAAAAVGATVIAPDKIQYPDGTIVDLIFDEGGSGQHLQYTEVGGPGASRPGAAGSPSLMNPATGYSPVSTPAAAPTTTPAPGASPTSSPMNDYLHGFLMDRLNATAAPIDPNNPRLTNQVDAYRNEQERALREGRDALAEKASFQGLPTGSVDSAIQGSYEKMGQNVGAFSANTLAQEYDKQRTSLQQLLALAVQSGDVQSAQQIQLYLGQLEAAARKQQLAQQNNQFYDTFTYGMAKDNSNIDKSLLDLLSGAA